MALRVPTEAWATQVRSNAVQCLVHLVLCTYKHMPPDVTLVMNEYACITTELTGRMYSRLYNSHKIYKPYPIAMPHTSDGNTQRDSSWVCRHCWIHRTEGTHRFHRYILFHGSTDQFANVDIVEWLCIRFLGHVTTHYLAALKKIM